MRCRYSSSFVGYSPQNATSGDAARLAVSSAVASCETPGPQVVVATPGVRVTRAQPSAMPSPAPSWRTSSILTPPSLSSSCIQYMLPSPMMPKICVTPSATKSAASLWYTFILFLLYSLRSAIRVPRDGCRVSTVCRVSNWFFPSTLNPRPFFSSLRSSLGAARSESLREFAGHALDHQGGTGLHQRGESAGNLDLRVNGNGRRARFLSSHDLKGHRRFHPRTALVVPAARGYVPGHRCAIQFERDLGAKSHSGRSELHCQGRVVRAVLEPVTQFGPRHAFDHGTRVRQHAPHDPRRRGHLYTFADFDHDVDGGRTRSRPPLFLLVRRNELIFRTQFSAQAPEELGVPTGWIQHGRLLSSADVQYSIACSPVNFSGLQSAVSWFCDNLLPIQAQHRGSRHSLLERPRIRIDLRKPE